MPKQTKEYKIKRNGINTARYIAMDTWSEDMEDNVHYMFHQQRMIDEEIAELRKRGKCDKKRNNYQIYEHEMIYLTAMSSEYKRLGEEYQQKCAGVSLPAAKMDNIGNNIDKKTNAGTLSPAVISESNGINSNKIDKTITSSKMKLSMKTKHYTRTCFTPQQVSELTAKAYSINPRLACLWHLGYLTGMRLNDLLKLEWSQVDLEKGVLGITERKPNCDERTKFPYLRKKYRLHGELLTILEQMKREDEPNCKYLFHIWQGEKIVHLTALNRKLINSIGLTETMKSGLLTVHLYSFHSLRASYFMRKRMADSSSESNRSDSV